MPLVGLLFLLTPTDLAVLTVDTSTVPIIDPIEVAKSEWIEALIMCESGNNPNIKVLDTDGYYSYGVGQFHQATWLAYGKSLGATKENIYDPDLQREVMRKMLDDGGWRHWFRCASRTSRLRGAYPSEVSASSSSNDRT